jgi:hypothetical protein
VDSRGQLPYTDCPLIHQPDSEPSESEENHSKKTTQTLIPAEPTLESRIRKEREGQELDENSKSTLECFSSWCQVLEESRKTREGWWCVEKGPNPGWVLKFMFMSKFECSIKLIILKKFNFASSGRPVHGPVRPVWCLIEVLACALL